MAEMLSQRQSQLLASVVEEYTKTCEPVGSKLIAERAATRVSSATVRNDMAALEVNGYLAQPHTSAGRIPTAAGYQYYVEHHLGDYRILARERRALQVDASEDGRERLKMFAKQLAELSGVCTVVGFSAHDVYYTGIANLFSQPEFQDYGFSFSMSEVIDHLDDAMPRLYEKLARTTDVQIFIGDRNPFGTRCSALVTGFGNRQDTCVVGVLGPLRMHYARNRSLLNHLRQAYLA